MSKCLTEKYFFEVIGNILSGIYVTIKLANLGAELSEHHFLFKTQRSHGFLLLLPYTVWVDKHIQELTLISAKAALSEYQNSCLCLPFNRNIQNVIAKMESGQGGGGSKDALLVNCHFDSVPQSPGASDDAVSCAIMLEILDVLMQSDRPFRHNLIFLFNGAEENLLPVSTGIKYINNYFRVTAYRVVQ